MQEHGIAPAAEAASSAENGTRKTYYDKSPVEILHEFGSRREGLRSKDEVAENREKFGKNKLQEAQRKGLLAVFADQFKDLLVIILIAAALISFLTGERASTIVIITVLIMNAILGTIQYFKAERSLESLKKLSSPEAKVIRDGVQAVIPAEDLVCGDIITLEAGDIIPGDARILECFSLKVNESSLTGESESVEKTEKIIMPGAAEPGDRAAAESETTIEIKAAPKTVALGDQKNMVFSGSLVTYGRATCVVTAVGKDTELGRIAELMSDTRDRKTPLQITMDNFSKKLSVAIMIICAVVFGLAMLRHMPVLDALLFAVALAVAAIPEALSSIITISLAIGTSRMAEENAIVKDLNAVEGLGCVSIICSDKTGTLTQNKMTVEHESSMDGCRDQMLLASILCNDTRRIDGELLGDPTETAYFDYYEKEKGEESLNAMLAANPRLDEVPFDSDRKLMSTLHADGDRFVMYTKGAIDVILSRAANLNDEQKLAVRKENFELSNSGLRVLGFARKYYSSQVTIDLDSEYDLEYIGLLAEMDPPREESAQAIADCIAAGIKPIMITGDHKITASAIARRIGIMHDGDLAFTGPEIDEMSEEELQEKLPQISVYARVSPDNKIRIVRAWQDRGHIVAMTGDGVNDGPALKSADVGVAMGITGTEVAKDSAAMILTDDNFATIIKSVLNGRNIYNNIKNAIKYLLSGNLAAIFVVLFASLAGLSMPFTAVQLLFINLITDSLPALAISMEPSNPELIHDKPRPRSESVLNRPTAQEILFYGILIALSTAAAFLIGLGRIDISGIPAIGAMIEEGNVFFSPVCASTMAFATLCLARLWHGFNCRGREHIFRLGLFSNWWTIGAFVLGAGLLHCILLMRFFSGAFGVSLLNPHLLLIVWILSFLPSLIIQIVKAIRYPKQD